MIPDGDAFAKALERRVQAVFGFYGAGQRLIQSEYAMLRFGLAYALRHYVIGIVLLALGLICVAFALSQVIGAAHLGLRHLGLSEAWAYLVIGAVFALLALLCLWLALRSIQKAPKISQNQLSDLAQMLRKTASDEAEAAGDDAVPMG